MWQRNEFIFITQQQRPTKKIAEKSATVSGNSFFVCASFDCIQRKMTQKIRYRNYGTVECIKVTTQPRMNIHTFTHQQNYSENRLVSNGIRHDVKDEQTATTTTTK